MDIQNAYSLWCRNVKNPELLAELKQLKNNTADRTDSFYRELSFGTAGLRGVMGAGTNRMNIYVVRRAALALGKVLGKEQSAVIAYDTRRNSRKFAEETACALAEKGVKVWLFETPVPLPMLSFAIRELGCGAGVMLTASHNPSQYNGFKCFGSDGAQISVKFTKQIAAAMEKTDYFVKKRYSFATHCKKGEIRLVDRDIYKAYLSAVLACRTAEDISDLSVLYTPLNGTGMFVVPQFLHGLGARMDTVAEQMKIDLDFSTCPSPNPENIEAFSLAMEQAERTNPDIILATDPDCDRIGVAVRHNEAYRLLTGNEIGCLLLDRILAERTKKEPLYELAVMIRSFVSSPMADAIMKSYGGQAWDVPVGFKYIGEMISALADNGCPELFIFAFEESCGYLAGTYCRDKDGVAAAMLICETAAYHKKQGMTLVDALENLYQKYGYYVNKTDSIVLPGKNGEQLRERIMARLRKKKVKTIADMKVTRYADHLKIDSTDVLEYECENARLIIRPSGTEPKLKIYMMAKAQSRENAEDIIESIRADAINLIGI
ncbi:MAG: phospho-sugar mutase [Ruminococcaceae bacterium]|nr:phospho-sugar mutase [Oscillospiraceae bacterium]